MSRSSKNLLEGIETLEVNNVNEFDVEVKNNETIKAFTEMNSKSKIKYYRNKITGEKIHWSIPNLEKKFEVLEVIEE
jgi:hypothetical protein